MAQALYRKWRSQSFDEVIGQPHVTQTLRNALRDGRVAHAYLFSGPRGTGKTSTARILAKALNCSAAEAERPCNRCPTCIAINEGRMLDLIEIDAASNNSVDDIRELREKVGFRPSEGRYKIYIVDEVHMLSGAAFNALLKTLEEPPPHTRFILATTEPHKIPATVLSRCQRFDFRRIPAPEIAEHLRHIVIEEGIAADDEALMAIARSAQGCMRDAISLLDQMISVGADRITLRQVQGVLGVVNAEAVIAFVEALAAKDAAAGLGLIGRLVVEGASLNEFTHQVIDHLRGVMVLQMTHDAKLLVDLPAETLARMRVQAQTTALAQTLHAIKCFSAALPALKGGYQPQLPLEIAFIEAFEIAPPPPVLAESAPAAPAALPPAVKVTPPPPAPIPAAEPPPLDYAAVERLRSRWKEFLGRVRGQSGIKVQAALNSVRDIAVSEGGVAFAFGSNSFARDMVARPETLGQVADVLAGFLGRSVRLECQLGEQAQIINPIGAPADHPASDSPDLLLEYAISNLGAEVVE